MSSTGLAVLSQGQLDASVKVVASWLGPRMGYANGTAPVGPEMARHALGPQFIEDFDWSGTGPRPALILEGGPEEWAIHCSMDPDVQDELRDLGVFAEPYTSWALCFYPY